MPKYLSDLTTREDVQEQLEKASPSSTLSPDFIAYIDSTIHSASAIIANYCERDFVAFKQSLVIYQNDSEWVKIWETYRGALICSLLSIPDADILEVDSITLDGTAIASSAYRLSPNNVFPSSRLVFDTDAVSLSTSNDFDSNLTIIGTFGTHHDPVQMYSEIEDSITIADTTTTAITVADASLYRTWQYIKLGDELMQITARDEDTEVLTVKRGVNGTTASAHSSVSVYVFNVIDDIRMACTRLVAWAYNNRNDLGTQLQLPDGSVVKNQVPAFVRETLNRHTKLIIGVV